MKLLSAEWVRARIDTRWRAPPAVQQSSFDMGFAAALSGGAFAANQFEPETLAHDQWEDGYTTAMAIRSAEES